MAAEAEAGPIDAVYTWVDGGDPGFRRAFNQALGHARERPEGLPSHADIGRNRYRDSNELRYSLRSIAHHAPWFNHVYLVTNGQQPEWLDRSAKGLTLVRHEQVFPDPHALPTFNSHAIETCLHHITGLSEHFIYFNDDVFIGRDVEPEDFMKAGQSINFFDDLPMDTALDPHNLTDRAYRHTRQLALSRCHNAHLDRLPAHVPRLFRRSEIQWLEETFPAEFESTRQSTFRSADDFVLRIAHAALLEEQGSPAKVLRNNSGEYRFLRLKPGLIRRWQDLRALQALRARMICINDELNDAPGSRIVRQLMVRCLERLFPVPSPFERPLSA